MGKMRKFNLINLQLIYVYRERYYYLESSNNKSIRNRVIIQYLHTLLKCYYIPKENGINKNILSEIYMEYKIIYKKNKNRIKLSILHSLKYDL